MRYSNPPLSSIDHEAALHAERGEFARLLLIVAGIVLALLLALDRLAIWAAPRLPFAWEVEIARSTGLDTLALGMKDSQASINAAQQQALTAELQRRLDRIAQAIELPPDIRPTAHFVDSPTINAVATLGGHVAVFAGLLRQLEYEEELDAVLAHELGHIQHRHMVRQLSRGLSAAAALGLVGIRSPTLNRWLIGDVQRFSQLAYSRQAEQEADATAAQASLRLYGHTGGLQQLFQRFQALHAKHGGDYGEWASMLQTHPHPAERLRAIPNPGAAHAALTPLRGALKLGPNPNK